MYPKRVNNFGILTSVLFNVIFPTIKLTNGHQNLGDENFLTNNNILPQTSHGSVKSAFFFLCNSAHQGEPATGLISNLTISLKVGGNRTFDNGYRALDVYEVLVDLNVAIDGFLLTGAHFLTKKFTESNHLNLPASSNNVNSAGLVCTTLHEHISRKPRTSFSVMWLAPHSGTGCVRFLATGSMQNKLLFKDLLVKEICERENEDIKKIGKLIRSRRLNMANDLNSFVLYENFDYSSLNRSVWQSLEEGKLDTIESFPYRTGHFTGIQSKISILKTNPLDFSNAQNLQYTLGNGDCKPGRTVKVFLGSILYDDKIDQSEKSFQDSLGDNLAYTMRTNTVREDVSDPLTDAITIDSSEVCNSWKDIDSQSTGNVDKVHITAIPISHQKNEICLMFKSESSSESDDCWTLDNVAVVTTNSHQGNVWEDFDDINPNNWIFFPGGQVKESCGSQGNAMQFASSGLNWIKSRQLDFSYNMTNNIDTIFFHDFAHNLDGFSINGNKSCFDGKNYGVNFGAAGQRNICSRKIDTGGASVFVLHGGIGACSTASEVKLKLQFFDEDILIFSHDIILDTVFSDKSINLPILKNRSISVCIHQEGQFDEDEESWSIKHLILLPWAPTNPEYYFQGLINLNCGDDSASVSIEASIDGGKQWSSIASKCTHTGCYIYPETLSVVHVPELEMGWAVVTLPLPYSSLGSHTIVRVSELSNDESEHRDWAIDNIFIGRCIQGCSGHGLCQKDGTCKCEYGLSGEACEIHQYHKPTYMFEPFLGDARNSANIMAISGGKNSFKCGVLGTGMAVVFDGSKERSLTTVDLDTTGAHVIQFYFQAGTYSDVGKCPGANQDEESVYVHYSCSGGTVWKLLHTLRANSHKSTRLISLNLPAEARNGACRFQIWQARHSGFGKDMWAIDELTISSKQHHSIEINFDDYMDANNSLRFLQGKIGKFCGKEESLVFSDHNDNGVTRYLETKSMSIGTSHIIQFDLVIGCDSDHELDSTIALEYSLTHGLTWQLVERQCTPSTPSCGPSFSRGTVYDSSEYNSWNRITLAFPQHVWAQSVRLRLRQYENSEVDIPWAVDNIYIGKHCNGCSGHGYCTSKGCRCDEKYHGYRCLPETKLKEYLSYNFDEGEVEYEPLYKSIGGEIANGLEGCGPITSGNNLYFGQMGIRQFETDDVWFGESKSITFTIVIGSDHATTKNCISSHLPAEFSDLNEGSVVLQFSLDAGMSWNLLKELVAEAYRQPTQFHMSIDEEIIGTINKPTNVIRFRLWQPKHSTADQWAVDDFKIKSPEERSSLMADFKNGSLLESPWFSSSQYKQKNYCKSDDIVNVFDSREPIRMAVTDKLTLAEGDVIMFEISVNCNQNWANGYQVILEYSKDGGEAWSIVQEKCMPSSPDCSYPRESSTYWQGHNGNWTKILIKVDHRLAESDINLRWKQQNPSKINSNEFALRKIYIGPPCEFDCHGHGMCTAVGLCKCDEGFKGKYCEEHKDNPLWMKDTFEDLSYSQTIWEIMEGSALSVGCGQQRDGHVLMFSDDGPRFIETKEIDTYDISYVAFELGIGAVDAESHCEEGISQRDNVLFEYSTNNGLLWHLITEFEPSETKERKKPYIIKLPHEARSVSTKFRWWQIPPYMLNKSEKQAEWELDNVLIMANETHPLNLDLSVDPSKLWFLVSGTDKLGLTNDIHFSDSNTEKYAETWDVLSQEGTFVQFDIKITNENQISFIRVEYSTDYGKMWKMFNDNLNSSMELNENFPSIYSSTIYKNQRRITIPVPIDTIGQPLRLRFIQQNSDRFSPGGSFQWSIENLFIGNSCPWMCNGHGYCLSGKCVCDNNYFGKFCVPERVLPCELLDNFDSGSYLPDLWDDIQGAEVNDRHGILVHKYALVFIKDSPRYATTRDLDMTSGKFLQFTIHHANSKSSFHRKLITQMEYRDTHSETDVLNIRPWENHHKTYEYGQINEIYSNENSVILIQSSINGGITWKTMEKILVEVSGEPGYFSISFNDFPAVMTNSTRFRIWQRGNYETAQNSWAIDSIYIGGSMAVPNILYDTFDSTIPNSDAWIEWPAGKVKSLCNSTSDEGRNGTLSFSTDEGQHALYSKDIHINPFSVIQFDIRIGCGNMSFSRESISLEYSTDYGITWKKIRSPCVPDNRTPYCLMDLQTPSIYYENSSPGWQRIIIPLTNLPACSSARFRWWQGYYHAGIKATEWSIDNVYIGPACIHHCGGHGYCINGDSCNCDSSYEGTSSCYSATEKPKQILADFENDKWINIFSTTSGAEASSKCEVINGLALYFWMDGDRILVTKDLDLENGRSVEFYLRFGCTEIWEPLPDPNPTIILMYSINGGVDWFNIKNIMFGNNEIRPQTNFFTIDLPIEAKTNVTKLRWWQPSNNGSYSNKWAIDHIYVTNTELTPKYFYDDGSGENWHIKPGSIDGSICGLKGIFFKDGDGPRFAETKSVLISPNSFIQVEVVIGCETAHCYELNLEYSINNGKTWNLIESDCLNSNECEYVSSILRSDVYTKPTIITILLPKILTSWQKIARFRVIQQNPYQSDQTWLVSRIYIGNECPTACLGRGFCDCGVCICDKGWKGENCEQREESLPDYIADDFETDDWSSVNWSKIIGGKVSNICGSVASQSSIYFYGSCTRLLESVDIDLRSARFVQFNLVYGCSQIDPEYNYYQTTMKTQIQRTFLIIQVSCNSGVFWKTMKKIELVYISPKYIWLQIPFYYRCFGGRIRMFQTPTNFDANIDNWAIDGILIGGKVNPSDALSAINSKDLKLPEWHKTFHWSSEKYCDHHDLVGRLESTPSEPALLQTRDIYVRKNHSIQFNISLGCGALWNNKIEPVRLEYSRDNGRNWNLVRTLCLPYSSSSCSEMNDESIFYAPQNWQYYVFPFNSIGPSKYTRFRWIQHPSADITGSHVWGIKDIYIGPSCMHYCLGRGKCLSEKCYCDPNYTGDYCEISIYGNLLYIKDEFKYDLFKPHWNHNQGALLSDGCIGEMEEPPSAVFKGSNGRVISSVPLDTRSSRFVLFTAQIGSSHGVGQCRRPTSRKHNVFLQYSTNGGIHWHLLRELDYNLYITPKEDYIILPRKAMTSSTSFRFWQPRMDITAPLWSIDNVFIGGSEIASSQFVDSFSAELTIAEWLFAPHSHMEKNYCQRGDNGSLVWEANHPGHRAITTQELITYDAHVLQFKISVGCQQSTVECYAGSIVHLEFNKDGGANGWKPLKDICYPETLTDPNCAPYVFHGPSTYGPDVYSSWTRVTIPLPEKAWSSSAQLRWIQDARRDGEFTDRIVPWALDDVYVGIACSLHCRGHGDCIEGKCECDDGYEGLNCLPSVNEMSKYLVSLVDGFEGGTRANWRTVTGGSVGLGCNSLAPYGNGKHLYFNGCGTRQAITNLLDARKSTKISFVLRIGSHDNTPSCKVDISNPKEDANKGILLQYSIDNGIRWETISFHDPLDFRKARRVAYNIPDEGKYLGLLLRWWQPKQNGRGTDQWALDNVELILNQRKLTNEYEVKLYR